MAQPSAMVEGLVISSADDRQINCARLHQCGFEPSTSMRSPGSFTGAKKMAPKSMESSVGGSIHDESIGHTETRLRQLVLKLITAYLPNHLLDARLLLY